MNILLGVLSFFLSFGIYCGVEKCFGHFFLKSPELLAKLNPYPKNDSRWQFYLYKIKKDIGMWFPFLFLFYLSYLIALAIEIKFPETTNSVFWINLCGLLVGLTTVLLVWILIQYLGDFFWDYGLKGFGEQYAVTLFVSNAGKIYVIGLLLGVLLVNFASGWIAEIFIMWFLRGTILLYCLIFVLGFIQVRVKSNIDERLESFRTFDEFSKAWEKGNDKDSD